MWARRRTITIYVGVVLFLYLTYLSSHWERPLFRSSLRDQRIRLWQQLYSLLEEYKPNCSQPLLRGHAGTQRFNALEETPRVNHIVNEDEILLPMQAAHDGFLHAIGNLKLDRAYIPGTIGIVSSAGGDYLPTFLVSLLVLRRTGSTLPVELFMKDRTEYEPSVCETVLPPLGAKCVVLSEILAGQNDLPNIEKVEHFQIKSFAILFSSFENFLWLDADCLSLDDPAVILAAEPFKSTGLVTWPDFWANSAAPVYFTISRQSEPPSTARQATEAGMMLISKKRHFSTLLLAAYYNYYGPDYYYILLDQGAPGAGDKDTFLHAAVALNETIYSVSEKPVDVGNVTPWNPNIAINAGYIQADPIQDYHLTSQQKWRAKDPSVANPPRAFFVHAGDPEFNPGKDLLGQKLADYNGKPTRLWTHPPEAIARLGYDIERTVWEATVSVACDIQPEFVSWESKSGLCEQVKEHWEAVFDNPDVPVPMFAGS